VTRGPLTDEAICRIIGSALPAAAARGGIEPGMALREDLGIDSVGLMSVVFVLEEQAGIDAFSYVQEFIGAQRVSDLITIVRQG
jgi:hypothetical protein